MRVNNHSCFIIKRRRESVAKHFFTDGHTFSDFQITAINIIPNAAITNFVITKYNTTNNVNAQLTSIKNIGNTS